MQTKNITGRDGYIQEQALFHAIALIQSQVVTSDCLDMCRIARAINDPEVAARCAVGVFCFYKLRLDIDPDNEDPAYKAAFNAAFDEHIARYENRAA